MARVFAVQVQFLSSIKSVAVQNFMRTRIESRYTRFNRNRCAVAVQVITNLSWGQDLGKNRDKLITPTVRVSLSFFVLFLVYEGLLQDSFDLFNLRSR